MTSDPVESEPPKEYSGQLGVTLSQLGLTASSAFAVVLGYLYTAGYLISAQYLRKYGIHRFEPVKPQYIEVGLTFTIMTILVTCLPAVAALLHFRVRSRSGLPHYRFGATLYFLNTLNIFMLLGFFVIFVTDVDWRSEAALIGGQQVQLGSALGVYLSIAVFCLIFLPIIERLIRKYATRRGPWYFLIVEPLRVGVVVAGLGFDVLLANTLPWTLSLLKRGAAFLGCAILLIGGIWGVAYWSRRVGRRRTLHLILVMGSVGILFASYLAISSYVWGVLRFIPMDRGGKLPLTDTYIFSSADSLADLPIESVSNTNTTRWGPVYLLEETSDFLYVTQDTTGNWFFEWVPIVGIDKSEVAFVTHQRIPDGGPRLTASVQGQP